MVLVKGRVDLVQADSVPDYFRREMECPMVETAEEMGVERMEMADHLATEVVLTNRDAPLCPSSVVEQIKARSSFTIRNAASYLKGHHA